MSFARAVLAAFIGGLLAIVVALAWRSSQKTGKSFIASFADVPTEAQSLMGDARSRAGETVADAKSRVTETAVDAKSRVTEAATDAKSRVTEAAADVKARGAEAVNTRLETIREKEAALKERIVGHAEEAQDQEVEGESRSGQTV